MTEMAFDVAGAMRALDRSKRQIIRYRQVGAPLLVALACAAVAKGLQPYA